MIFSELYNNFKNKYLSFSKIDRNYEITLKNEEKFENRNKLIDIDYSWISKKYELDKNYFNDKGILKEERRIIKHKIELIQKNDPKDSLKFQIQGAFKTLSNILDSNKKINNGRKKTVKKKGVDLEKKVVHINKNIQKEVNDMEEELDDMNKNNKKKKKNS